MWGSMENKDAVWSSVQLGDLVLFYTDGHFAPLRWWPAKCKTPRSLTVVWNPEPDSWRNILFFGSVWSISLPVSSVAALLDYATNWSGPREFFVPALAAQKRALSQFANIEDFAASLTAESFGTGGAPGQSYADVIGQVETDADVQQIAGQAPSENHWSDP